MLVVGVITTAVVAAVVEEMEVVEEAEVEEATGMGTPTDRTNCQKSRHGVSVGRLRHHSHRSGLPGVHCIFCHSSVDCGFAFVLG